MVALTACKSTLVSGSAKKIVFGLQSARAHAIFAIVLAEEPRSAIHDHAAQQLAECGRTMLMIRILVLSQRRANGYS
jgi:hypothetical protein